jgi:hypothetical protein
MSNLAIVATIFGAVAIAVVWAALTLPQSRAGLGYYNGERQLGLAYGCGMVAENNRLLKLQELKPITENEWCAKYRKIWEGM